MDIVALSVAQLVERARGLAEQGGRRLLGITGAPGAGKSTVARAVVDALGPQLCALVPMDGFHLANVTLIAWGRRDRDRKSTRLNSSHLTQSRMPSSA